MKHENPGFFSMAQHPIKTIRELSQKIQYLEDNPRRSAEKTRKQIEELVMTRRNFIGMVLAGLLGIGLASTGLGYLGVKKYHEMDIEKAKISDFHTIPPFVPKSTDEIEKLMEMQEYWKQTSLDSINLFKDVCPEVREVIDFLTKNAFYSIPVGPVVTRRIARGMGDFGLGNPNSFEIVYMPEMYASRMASSIITESSGRTMRIASNFKLKEWLGIMQTHEMTHIINILVNHENPFNKDEWLMGEVNAHLLEMKLLKYWNPHTYECLMKYGIPLYRSNDSKQLISLIKQLYPLDTVVSHNESMLGGASCLIAVAFEEGRERGLGDTSLKDVYQKVVKESW